MATSTDLQVMQETMRLVLLAICDAGPVKRAALAKALAARAYARDVDPQTRVCMQELAKEMAVIAPGFRPDQ